MVADLRASPVVAEGAVDGLRAVPEGEARAEHGIGPARLLVLAHGIGHDADPANGSIAWRRGPLQEVEMPDARPAVHRAGHPELTDPDRAEEGSSDRPPRVGEARPPGLGEIHLDRVARELGELADRLEPGPAETDPVLHVTEESVGCRLAVESVVKLEEAAQADQRQLFPLDMPTVAIAGCRPDSGRALSRSHRSARERARRRRGRCCPAGWDRARSMARRERESAPAAAAAGGASPIVPRRSPSRATNRRPAPPSTTRTRGGHDARSDHPEQAPGIHPSGRGRGRVGDRAANGRNATTKSPHQWGFTVQEKHRPRTINLPAKHRASVICKADACPPRPACGPSSSPLASRFFEGDPKGPHELPPASRTMASGQRLGANPTAGPGHWKPAVAVKLAICRGIRMETFQGPIVAASAGAAAKVFDPSQEPSSSR